MNGIPVCRGRRKKGGGEEETRENNGNDIMLQHDSEAEDPIPIFANDDDGNHHHDPKHIGGRWGDRFLLLAAFLCLVATAAVVGILGVASVYCVTDRSADILERCSPEDSGLPITLPAINALTLALYCMSNTFFFGTHPRTNTTTMPTPPSLPNPKESSTELQP